MTVPVEINALRYPWRVGRKLGRTIYAQLGPEPSADDPLLGTLDSPELAAEAVRCHNHLLKELNP